MDVIWLGFTEVHGRDIYYVEHAEVLLSGKLIEDPFLSVIAR